MNEALVADGDRIVEIDVNTIRYETQIPEREQVPGALLSRHQWVAWWGVPGTGERIRLPNGNLTLKPLKSLRKPHKLPIDPHTGGLAETDRKATWGNYDEAVDAARRFSLTGVGFVFTQDDPFSGIDLDDCRDRSTGELDAWAMEIIEQLRTYSEVSPSRTGVKLWVCGTLPKGKGNQATCGQGKVEMFSQGRYFTFTGQNLDGAHKQIENRQEALSALHSRLFGNRSARTATKSVCSAQKPLSLSDSEMLERARRARNGTKFQRLWDGAWETEYISQSEADMALCCQLAYWTGCDSGRIDSLFRQSGLMRGKWDRQDYRERTIEAAVTHTASTFKGAEPRNQGPASYESARVGAATSGERLSAGEGKTELPDLLDLPYTDTGNAERLIRLYGEDIRFCSEMKKWLVWDGLRWSFEDTRRVKMLQKKTMRLMHAQAAEITGPEKRGAAEKHSRKSESAASISAALTCAEYEAGIPISANAMDRQPFLLNFNNGTFDFVAGHLRQHRRGDLITKLVHFDYQQNADCPQFKRFLYRIMGDGPDACERNQGRADRLARYLQKCFGYALTGDVAEKIVFCFFGVGNNGKTTLLEIIRFVLAEYSAQVLIDTLMAHKSRESNSSLADLADLRGARFVTTSEAEEGQRLAIGKLKYLSQGMGEIKTCRKYENPIKFPATHKLFLDANHKPMIRGVEKAAWNRLKPVPFNVIIPPEEIDKGLLEKLKAEAEGILAWMVEGCLRWMREGLGDPPEVSEASAAWQAESDRFSVFLEERCVVDVSNAKLWVPVARLWPAYQEWCEVNGEKHALAKMDFDKRIEDLGCKRGFRESATVRAWLGIRFRTVDDDRKQAEREPKL